MIDQTVRAALKGLFAGRVYPDTFLQKNGKLPTLPACRYTRVSGINFTDICGSDHEDTDNTRVQIDIIAGTYDERETLIADVITAMMGLDPPCYRSDGVNREFDQETRNYRAFIDFIFTPSSAVVS